MAYSYAELAVSSLAMAETIAIIHFAYGIPAIRERSPVLVLTRGST